MRLAGFTAAALLISLPLPLSAQSPDNPQPDPASPRFDTSMLEQPWPKAKTSELEVGRYPVRWRHFASKRHGIYAGVRFDVPLGREEVWRRSNEYQDVGKTIPGVEAVRYLEQSDTHELIQIDVKVLWKELTLNFEIEKDPPRLMRFQLRNPSFGEYRGVCLYEERQDPATGATTTSVDLSTWLDPARPVPLRMLLMVERMALLQGARKFLEACDDRVKLKAAATAPAR